MKKQNVCNLLGSFFAYMLSLEILRCHNLIPVIDISICPGVTYLLQEPYRVTLYIESLLKYLEAFKAQFHL